MFTKIKSISITYNILNGCRYSCTGCLQDKFNNDQITDQEYEELLFFYEDLKKNNVKIVELALGPTDFMSASNRTELMNDPRLMKLISYGRNLDVNFSCLDQNEDRLNELVNELKNLPKGTHIEFGIPYEFDKRFNQKYQKHLVKTIDILQGKLGNIIEDFQFTINYNHDEFVKQFKEELTQESFNEMIQRQIYPNAKVDLFLPELLKDLTDLNVRMSLRRSIDGANKFYIGRLEEDLRNGEATWHPVISEEGFPNSQRINYYKGDFYLCVVVFDNALVIHPYLKVKKPWTYENLLNTVLELQERAFDYSLKTNHCSTCPHLWRCAPKGTITLMEIARYKDCITMLRGNEDLLSKHRDIVISKVSGGERKLIMEHPI